MKRKKLETRATEKSEPVLPPNPIAAAALKKVANGAKILPPSPQFVVSMEDEAARARFEGEAL